jgi:hypothetical protein
MKPMPFCRKHNRHSQSGSAVLMLLAFLALMLIFCAATTRAIFTTRKELKLIEKHQLARLAAATNSLPASAQSTHTQ